MDEGSLCEGVAHKEASMRGQAKGEHPSVECDLSSTPASALRLAQTLVRARTTTPARGEIFDRLDATLEAAGFACRRYLLGEGAEATDNLYARAGKTKPVLVFCGHLDTVCAGDASLWSQPPYAGEVKDGVLIGRGSVDMKGSVAAFITAARDFLAEENFEQGNFQHGSIVVLLTGDEEGSARFGTRALLEELGEEDKDFDACLTGEPTSDRRLGDRIKIGRRGSLSLRLRVRGKAGHSAYPHLAENAAHKFLPFLCALSTLSLDAGTKDGLFEPSTLQIASLATDTQVSNMLPGRAEALVSIRYNPLHDEPSLLALLRRHAREHGIDVDMERLSGAEVFFTPANAFSTLVVSAIEEVCGVTPCLSTAGGTSDSRFLYSLCPTLDFGPVGASMHAVDESIPIADLEQLRDVYHVVLRRFFS